MRRTVLLLTTMMLALIAASGIALAETQLDQQQTLTDGGFAVVDQSTSTDLAQTFTAGQSGTIDKVSLYVGCCADASGNIGGTPPDYGLLVLIRGLDSSTGLPNGDFISYGTVPAANFTSDGSLGWVDVPLKPFSSVSSGGIVTAGKQYAIQLEVNGCFSTADLGEEDPCPPLSTSGYQWGRTTPSAYAGGTAWKISPIYPSGWAWESQDQYDFAFKTFVGGSTTTASNDTTPPDTIITSGPNDPTNDNTPTFSFSGSDDLSSTASLLYSYKVDDGLWSNYSSATSVTLGDASGLLEGSHTFYVKAKDETGNEDATPAQQSFTVDTASPTGTVVINGGASRTRTRSVTLTLSASDPSPVSGVTQMRISNTQSGLASASWETYATSRLWTLSSGTGTKTVYVQYMDAADNISAAATDTITYKP